jgi:PRC-barrel domain protein
MEDEGNPISYRLLSRGTPVHSSDGEQVGTVDEVLATDRENIFDGIVIRTDRGRRFVDAPEVARITDRRVTISITSAAAADLPEPERSAPAFVADPGAGRLARLFGGGWKRRH